MNTVMIEKKDMSYGELVNAVEKHGFTYRFEVICYFLVRCNAMTIKDYDMINQLHADGFIVD